MSCPLHLHIDDASLLGAWRMTTGDRAYLRQGLCDKICLLMVQWNRSHITPTFLQQRSSNLDLNSVICIHW